MPSRSSLPDATAISLSGREPLPTVIAPTPTSPLASVVEGSGLEPRYTWAVDLGDELRAMTTLGLLDALRTGELSPTVKAWRLGREAWTVASDIPELWGGVLAALTPMPQRSLDLGHAEDSPRLPTPTRSGQALAEVAATTPGAPSAQSSTAHTPRHVAEPDSFALRSEQPATPSSRAERSRAGSPFDPSAGKSAAYLGPHETTRRPRRNQPARASRQTLLGGFAAASAAVFALVVGWRVTDVPDLDGDALTIARPLGSSRLETERSILGSPLETDALESEGATDRDALARRHPLGVADPVPVQARRTRSYSPTSRGQARRRHVATHLEVVNAPRTE